MKPLIGISCSMGQAIYSLHQDNPPQLQHRMNDTYAKAVLQAGGIPVILPNIEDLSTVSDIVQRLDGFLLSGGDDVDPALYGQRATGKLGHVIPRRDNFELELAKTVFYHTNKPLLCICRGIQVLNVMLGGSLHIDLPEDGKLCHSLSMYPRNVCSHEIEVAEDTRLADIMGAGKGSVNSFHHQAIRDLGRELTISARSLPDGVIEAVEAPGRRFVVGVQWHPEELTDREEARRLFEDFIAAAKTE